MKGTDRSSSKLKFSKNPRHIDRTTPVQYIKGVGPVRARLLERLGIRTFEDIIYYLPWRYEDRRNLRKIGNLRYGNLEITMGEVMAMEVTTTPNKKMKIFEMILRDETGYLRAKWFNQPFLKSYFKKGDRVILCGTVRWNPYTMDGIEMDNPDFEIIGKGDDTVHTSRIIPVYRATEGISPRQLRTLMYSTVSNYLDSIEEYIPPDILIRNNLRPLKWAIKEAHFPEEIQDVDALNQGVSEAHKRLAFDELFLLELGLAILKKREEIEKGISFYTDGELLRRFFEALPFELTKAQKRVIQEIKHDMQRPIPMNRLVHGDVGCGKTIIALAAMLMAVDSGYQACLMAPTEILAEQHYINIHRIVEDLGVKVALLTSSKREKPIEEISSGHVQLVIGTHALIQEYVRFRNLGIAVIDEQHRFGVVQRATLRQKGINPDVLIMTATPIPRTLALSLYGDLDISIIDELPSGRRPVKTKVLFPSQKTKIYQLMEEEMQKGHQIYVVYPVIEGSEKMDLKSAIEGAEALKQKFPHRVVGLIHGRIHHTERERIMSEFVDGKIDILVSTTVIEVGIDVPNATLMLIVHAERFGLAQLHQLRGRIGRGSHESYCILLAYPPLSEEAKRRLRVMEESSDGFRIAEEDLAIRGPGDFFGTRQSGMPDLKLADIVRDIKLLEIARNEAFRLIERDPSLSDYPLLREVLEKRWMGRLELIKS